MPHRGNSYAKALWQDGAWGILRIKGVWLEQNRALKLKMHHLLPA